MAKRLCSVEDCESKENAKGFCPKHYARWRRHGHPGLVQPQGLPLAQRFAQHLERKPNGCLEWTRRCTKQGYGQFVVDRGGKRYKTELAHRVAWELEKGEIPDNLFVCHRCDNPPCCDVDHLFLGTAKDNTQDGIDKGRIIPLVVQPARRARGSRSGMAKLTEDQVREIKTRYGKDGVTQQMLATEFGVTQGKISYIIRGKTWKHVEVA